MVKSSSVFICNSCGFESSKWLGQCPSCKEWNSFVETIKAKTPSGFSGRRNGKERNAAVNVEKLSSYSSTKISRTLTGFRELDRVLGGGIVPGSLILVAGPPGIGKSSLLTAVVSKLKGLYVLGEESPEQVRLRVERLGFSTDFEVLPETNVETISETINKQPVVIVDSIQTIWTERLTGVAGSIGQVRESAGILLQAAKATGVPVIMVGHVTKEGTIAGPKVLEHLVDTVLQFEGDGKHEFRLLRAEKNRFGPTDEVGVFAMQDKGLVEVSNPSELFLQTDRALINPAGSVVVCSMAGVRPVLIEIQALVNPTSLAIPRRVGTGIDQRRLQILTAVLEKHANLKLGDKDVFVNVAGGLSLKEPASDVGICLAIASSYKNKPIDTKSVCIGEVGLLGEIRQVSFLDKRIKEAKAQGFSKIYSSKTFSLIREAISSLLLK
jgi:DNA repair protein RadA/Sms